MVVKLESGPQFYEVYTAKKIRILRKKSGRFSSAAELYEHIMDLVWTYRTTHTGRIIY